MTLSPQVKELLRKLPGFYEAYKAKLSTESQQSLGVEEQPSQPALDKPISPAQLREKPSKHPAA